MRLAQAVKIMDGGRRSSFTVVALIFVYRGNAQCALAVACGGAAGRMATWLLRFSGCNEEESWFFPSFFFSFLDEIDIAEIYSTYAEY